MIYIKSRHGQGTGRSYIQCTTVPKKTKQNKRKKTVSECRTNLTHELFIYDLQVTCLCTYLLIYGFGKKS